MRGGRAKISARAGHGIHHSGTRAGFEPFPGRVFAQDLCRVYHAVWTKERALNDKFMAGATPHAVAQIRRVRAILDEVAAAAPRFSPYQARPFAHSRRPTDLRCHPRDFRLRLAQWSY
jgi:hypothetical protein